MVTSTGYLDKLGSPRSTVKHTFVSGIFIPLQDLPNWGRAIAFLSPLTYANNLMSQSATGTVYLSAPANIAALFAFWAVFLLAGVKLHAVGKKV